MTTIDRLTPKHDYSEENCYLVFYHNAKPTQTIEIKAEWFDINHGNKVVWLLVREKANNQEEKTKYRNIKFENIDSKVRIIKRKKEKVI